MEREEELGRATREGLLYSISSLAGRASHAVLALQLQTYEYSKVSTTKKNHVKDDFYILHPSLSKSHRLDC